VNDSSTGGALLPLAAPDTLQGQSFEDFLQQVLVGLTGMAGDLVRPRWQLEPPNLPDIGTDWCAFGITTWEADTYAAVTHQGAGDGSDLLQRHETVDLLVSFFGPNCVALAARLRDGLQIAQNREVLVASGIGLQEASRLVRLPSLTKDRWLDRVDLSVILRRMVLRSYPVLNLLSAHGTIHTDTPPFALDFNA
jgi:hypothetical protein